MASSRSRAWFPDLEVLRALACVAVIGAHLIWQATRPAEAGLTRALLLTLAQPLVLSVGWFAIISGFLLARSFPAGRPWSDLRPRLLAIGLPTLLWSLLYLLLDCDFFLGWSAAVAWRTAWRSLLFGVEHLYFINVLFQFYLAFPALRWAKEKLGAAPFLGLCLMITSAYLWLAPGWLAGVTLPKSVWASYAGFLPAWLAQFAFGMVAADQAGRLRRPPSSWRPAITLAALALTAAMALWYYERLGALGNEGPAEIPNFRPDGALLGMVTATALLPLCDRLARTSLLPALRVISAGSFALYLMHPLAQRVAAHLLGPMAAPGPAVALYGAVTVTLTAALFWLASLTRLMRKLTGLEQARKLRRRAEEASPGAIPTASLAGPPA